MSATETTAPVPPIDSPFTSQLAAAFRGGVILLAGSLLWGLFLPLGHDPFMHLCFAWLPSAWVVFPVGALLGYFLPRWVSGRGLAATLGIGVLVGICIGLLLTTGFLLVTNHHDLIGLWKNRSSGGYASYSYSVRQQLWGNARHALMGVAPVTSAWVVAWTLVFDRLRHSYPSALPRQNPSTTVHLRLDRHLFRLVGWVAAGFALFATAGLVLTSLAGRGVKVPLGSFLVVGPGAAGLVVLGPWLGPLINPGGGSTAAWQFTAVALPVLIAGFAPFAFWRRPVRPGTAILAWCGFVTALLFWVAAGVMSLGWSLG